MRSYLKKGYGALTSREFIIFLIGGGSAFLIDFTLLKFQTHILHFNLDLFDFIFIPNVISTGTAILYSFFFQRLIAFKAQEGKVYNQFVKHISLHSANLVIFNTLLFGILWNLNISLTITKVLVTMVQMFWSFVAYKFFVFTKVNNVTTKWTIHSFWWTSQEAWWFELLSYLRCRANSQS